MRARLKNTALIVLVAMSGLAAECFDITDPFVIPVNVKDIKNTYVVTPGTINFAPACITKNVSDYLDAGFDVSGGGQLVDITIKTNGTYAGNIVGGQIRVGPSLANLTTLVTYSGSWSAFNSPQSLLQNNVTMSLNEAGRNSLMNIIENQGSVVICHGGAFSQAATTGMSIDVTIFAQVNATP